MGRSKARKKEKVVKKGKNRKEKKVKRKKKHGVAVFNSIEYVVEDLPILSYEEDSDGEGHTIIVKEGGWRPVKNLEEHYIAPPGPKGTKVVKKLKNGWIFPPAERRRRKQLGLADGRKSRLLGGYLLRKKKAVKYA